MTMTPNSSKIKQKKFPVANLLPKEETQATQFLLKYPEYDGRGLVVAILDTGVDVNAPGLQSTTVPGQPKIVDAVDCTGSGDVVLSADQLQLDSEGFLVYEDVKLTIPHQLWKNPTGQYRVGFKSSADLFPAGLQQRLNARKKEQFDSKHQSLVQKVQNELTALNNDHNKKLAQSQSQYQQQQQQQSEMWRESGDQQQLLVKADLENRLQLLKDFQQNYEEPPVVFAVVVFHDGMDWVAAVDTAGQLDFTEAKLLRDFKIAREHDKFGEEDQLNYSVKFYDEGRTLSIVTVAGAHGSHVAGICCAHHPEEPALNGIAPGAQLISLKIGDTRLGSMETGTGLTRALVAILESGVQLCNMSYGEDTSLSNQGHWLSMLRDQLINKHHITFVSSAGNAGPALSTVGAPVFLLWKHKIIKTTRQGANCDGVIGVGAYVTAGMIEAEYALLENVPDAPYTWSSRGPCLDGDAGVSIYGPGAAITSVPQYCLSTSQLMNGTSMSGPSVCGHVALLMSALQQKQIKASPYRLKKALENSARCFGDEMKVGFLQVEDAYNYLLKYKDDRDCDVFYSCTTINGKRGVYLREANETDTIQSFPVTVTPVFRKDDMSEQTLKLQLEQRLVLTSNNPMIRVPDYLLFNGGGRTFNVEVDPTKAAPGLHYAEVCAFESGNIEKGPIFKFPVTITKPVILQDEYKYSFAQCYQSGYIDRKFVRIPEGATWAEMRVRMTGVNSVPVRVVVHLMQLIPQTRHSRNENHWYFTLAPSDPLTVKKFKVKSGLVMEICTCQFWSSAGVHRIEFDFEFHGISIQNEIIVLHQSHECGRLEFQSPLRVEDVNVSIQFEYLRKSLRPADSVIKPLLQRDNFDGTVMNELLLSYNLKLSETTSVIIRKPLVDDMLYENQFDSVLMMIQDLNKRVYQFGDVYAKQLKLAKGSYTVRVQLRHQHMEVLEKLKDMCVVVDCKLPKTESLDCYANLPTLADKDRKPFSFKKYTVKAGEQCVMYVPTQLEVKDGSVGDMLIGDLKFFSDKIEQGQYVAHLVIAPKTVDKPQDSDPESTKKDTKLLIEDAVRDAKLSVLKKLKGSDKDALFQQLLADYPNDVDVLVLQLNHLATFEVKSCKDLAEKSDKIISLADKIIHEIDEVELKRFISAKTPEVQCQQYKKTKKEFDEKKKQISAAYHRKLEALISAYLSGDKSADIQKLVETTWVSYWQFIDLKDVKNVYVAVARERIHNRHGTALSHISKFLLDNGMQPVTSSSAIAFVSEMSSSPSNRQDTPLNELKRLNLLRLELLQDLQWTVIEEKEQLWSKTKFPYTESVF